MALKHYRAITAGSIATTHCTAGLQVDTVLISDLLLCLAVVCLLSCCSVCKEEDMYTHTHIKENISNFHSHNVHLIMCISYHFPQNSHRITIVQCYCAVSTHFTGRPVAGSLNTQYISSVIFQRVLSREPRGCAVILNIQTSKTFCFCVLVQQTIFQDLYISLFWDIKNVYPR